MIDASKLPCMQTSDVGTNQTDQGAATEAEQAADNGSVYPAKRLVFENGTYRPVDHVK